ncbi:substrate-binding periplasmic protein [Desulfovibrio psychrotolerans]|uniref:Solute-binding protein family 3/N-terminal domain-containing protein n=1 Tax=Desulfovibrio psychrotolerans TaxID=415242 RepID=A0A7J0BXL4_9BACT|nr:transporter substrate-binding domain-containing protein [Desulfovibrio psychrotolerans]GFM38437.1 hypothetical protein DSM19430T_31210 [Desulfovibrio psychrotolerans]
MLQPKLTGILLVLHILFVFFCLSGRADAQVIEVLYMERPPYYYTKDHKPAGFLLEQSLRVFQKAGVEVRVRSLPAKRILQIVQEGQAQVAAIGWFKSKDRLAWASFSSPLYRDQPLIALHRKKAKDGLGETSSLSDLFTNPQLRLGVLDGYSYGDQVDDSIRRLSPPRFVLSGDQVQLVRMLAAGRVDYMLIAPEEVSHLLLSAGENERDFSFTLLADVPEGNTRYIMFSRSVSPEIIRRVNLVLQEAGW